MTLLTFWYQHHKCRHGVRKLSQRGTGKTYKVNFLQLKIDLHAQYIKVLFLKSYFSDLQCPTAHIARLRYHTPDMHTDTFLLKYSATNTAVCLILGCA